MNKDGVLRVVEGTQCLVRDEDVLRDSGLKFYTLGSQYIFPIVGNNGHVSARKCAYVPTRKDDQEGVRVLEWGSMDAPSVVADKIANLAAQPFKTWHEIGVI